MFHFTPLTAENGITDICSAVFVFRIPKAVALRTPVWW